MPRVRAYPGLNRFNDSFRKDAVNVGIAFPKFVRICGELSEVMEVWPDSFVAESVVEERDVFITQKDRQHSLLLQLRRNL